MHDSSHRPLLHSEGQRALIQNHPRLSHPLILRPHPPNLLHHRLRLPLALPPPLHLGLARFLSRPSSFAFKMEDSYRWNKSLPLQEYLYALSFISAWHSFLPHCLWHGKFS